MTSRFVFVIAVATLAGCHSLWPDDDLVGDGNLIDVRVSVPAFTGVEVDNSFAVAIAIGEPEVVVTLDANIVAADIVRVAVDERGMLVIRQCDDCRDFAPSAGAAVRCASPVISTIRTTGEVTASAEANAAEVVLDASGESRLVVHLIGAATVSASARDLATLELSGAAPTLSVRASDETTFAASGTASAIDVIASDLARVSGRATDFAGVAAAGGAAVVIFGEPTDRAVDISEDATVRFPGDM